MKTSEVMLTCKMDATFIVRGKDAKKIQNATNEDLVECFTKTMLAETGADDISVKDLKVFITK